MQSSLSLLPFLKSVLPSSWTQIRKETVATASLCTAYASTLKIEAVLFSEMSIKHCLSSLRHRWEVFVYTALSTIRSDDSLFGSWLMSRSRYPSCLRRVLSSLAWKPGSWIRIPLRAWMFSVCICVFLSLCTGRGPSQGVLPTVLRSSKPKWNGEFHGGRPRSKLGLQIQRKKIG
jgi:hypothetical protein